jgi:hypothetical protein
MAIQKTLHLHQKRGVHLEIIGVILCDIIIIDSKRADYGDQIDGNGTDNNVLPSPVFRDSMDGEKQSHTGDSGDRVLP